MTLVDIDDRAGTRELARHLHELGHRRVEVVAMPLRLDGTRGMLDAARRARAHYRDVRHRLEGVEDVFGPAPAFETASNAVAEGVTAGRALLDVPADRRPTAVIAQSDVLAAGVLQAAAELGLRVPQDVSVAGFDGADLPWLGDDPADHGRAAHRREGPGRGPGRDGAGRGRAPARRGPPGDPEHRHHQRSPTPLSPTP